MPRRSATKANRRFGKRRSLKLQLGGGKWDFKFLPTAEGAANTKIIITYKASFTSVDTPYWTNGQLLFVGDILHVPLKSGMLTGSKWNETGYFIIERFTKDNKGGCTGIVMRPIYRIPSDKKNLYVSFEDGVSAAKRRKGASSSARSLVEGAQKDLEFNKEALKLNSGAVCGANDVTGCKLGFKATVMTRNWFMPNKAATINKVDANGITMKVIKKSTEIDVVTITPKKPKNLFAFRILPHDREPGAPSADETEDEAVASQYGDDDDDLGPKKDYNLSSQVVALEKLSSDNVFTGREVESLITSIIFKKLMNEWPISIKEKEYLKDKHIENPYAKIDKPHAQDLLEREAERAKSVTPISED
jgi:hypothetical protein